MEDIQFVGFLSKLLETKILQVLRFKHGQIYSAGVSVFLGGNKPSRVDNVRGDISVNFSCDPDISTTLEEGPTDEDVLTILEIEQRAHENGLQGSSAPLVSPSIQEIISYFPFLVVQNECPQ